MKKKIIVMVSEYVDKIGFMRHVFRERNFDSIACVTIANMIEELKDFPRKESIVAIVVDPALLKRMTEDLKKQLSECVPKVQLLLLYKNVEAETEEIFNEISQNRAQLATKEKVQSVSAEAETVMLSTELEKESKAMH